MVQSLCSTTGGHSSPVKLPNGDRCAELSGPHSTFWSHNNEVYNYLNSCVCFFSFLELRTSTSVRLRLWDVPSCAAPTALHPNSTSAGQLLPSPSLPRVYSQVNPSRNRSSTGQLKGNSAVLVFQNLEMGLHWVHWGCTLLGSEAGASPHHFGLKTVLPAGCPENDPGRLDW